LIGESTLISEQCSLNAFVDNRFFIHLPLSLPVMSQVAESILYESDSNSLRILNQLLLPANVEYEFVKDTQDVWNAIKQMKVRGAPAIAILGLLGVAVELGDKAIVDSFESEPVRLLAFLQRKVRGLPSCHTAVRCVLALG